MRLHMEVMWQGTHDGDEETDVCFGEAVTDEVVFALEDLLETIERVEERVDGRLVGLLRGGETGLIHSICAQIVRNSQRTWTRHG